jgi:hypothetical protein
MPDSFGSSSVRLFTAIGPSEAAIAIVCISAVKMCGSFQRSKYLLLLDRFTINMLRIVLAIEIEIDGLTL